MAIFKFFDTPFGVSGTQTTIPDPVQGSGAVSFTAGYGTDYTLPPGAPGVLYPENGEFNWLMCAITSATQQWQVHAFPDFIAAADNGGTAYSYDKNSFVRWTDGNIYCSLVNTNTTAPPDISWLLFNPNPSNFQTGMTIIHEDVILPTGGWVWANGTTVGNASSNATGLAATSTQNLFSQIWRAFPNGVRQLYNSSGAPISRGVSAAVDYAANCALPVRNMCGYTAAGFSLMGGVANNNILTGYMQGVDASVFGNSGGEQSHTPIINEMPAHDHTGIDSPNFYQAGGTNTALRSLMSGGTTQTIVNPTGNGANFNVVQPTTICSFVTKL